MANWGGVNVVFGTCCVAEDTAQICELVYCGECSIINNNCCCLWITVRAILTHHLSFHEANGEPKMSGGLCEVVHQFL